MMKALFKKFRRLANPYLPHEIIVEVEGLQKEYVSNEAQVKNIYKQADDQNAIYDYNTSSSKYALPILFSASIVFFLFFLPKEHWLSIEGKILFTVLFILLALSLLYAHFEPKHFIVLDRKNHLMTFPRALWRKHHTAPFDQLKAYRLNYTATTGQMGMDLAVKDPKAKKHSIRLRSHIIEAFNHHETWSFYVWYMDRNRPLPPGTAFDPYREQDFQRRKAEGFPPPLYRSRFPTPEATPEQQAEREQHWLDEDYIERFHREPESVRYQPDIHHDWEKVQFLEGEDKIPKANSWYKYAFEDGRIVYMETDAEGHGYMPPESEKYQLTEMIHP